MEIKIQIRPRTVCSCSACMGMSSGNFAHNTRVLGSWRGRRGYADGRMWPPNALGGDGSKYYLGEGEFDQPRCSKSCPLYPFTGALLGTHASPRTLRLDPES